MNVLITFLPWTDKTVIAARLVCVLIALIVFAVCSSDIVQPPPSTTVTKIPSQLALLRCRAEEMNPLLVAWVKDGKPVSELGSKFVLKKRTGSLLVYVESTDDEGNYTCYAEEGPEFQPYTVYLKVSLPPEVKIESLNPVQPMEGGEITIICSAYGKPRPSFEWFSSQESRIIPKQSYEQGERLRVEERVLDALTIETSLVVSPVTSEDRGQFKCIATNAIGSDRQEVSVDVRFGPKMLTPNISHEVHWWEGHRVNLTCRAQGNPAPAIVWWPSDVIVPTVTVTEGIVVASTLWFSDSNSARLPASFRCQAENMYGETKSSLFTIHQVYAPPPPTLTIVSIQDDEIHLSITVPARVATPTPTFIKFDYIRQNSTQWISSGTAYEGNGTAVKLLGVILGRYYHVKVKVFNRVGFSDETTLNILAEQFPAAEDSTTTEMTTPRGKMLATTLGDRSDNSSNTTVRKGRTGSSTGGEDVQISGFSDASSRLTTTSSSSLLLWLPLLLMALLVGGCMTDDWT